MARKPPLISGLTVLDRTDPDGAAHLLGYSMGGRLALYFALAYPERTRTLTLVSASPGIASLTERAERRRRDNALADRIEQDGIAAFVDYWQSLPMWKSQRRNLSLEQRQHLREQRLHNLPHRPRQQPAGHGHGRATPSPTPISPPCQFPHCSSLAPRTRNSSPHTSI